MHHRILLCASAAHCAQVLQAAAAQRIHLHGLQPHTDWPTTPPTGAPTALLWALLPPSADPTAHAREAQWRSQLLRAAQGFTLHMLYGSAAQQAQQLAPWLGPQAHSPADAPALEVDCHECLDARSEHQLFQHLLQRSGTR